jgi:regulator of sigma E protease
MLSILVNILLFILVIGVLTFVHELGHFLAAKLVKATVYEFSLGFGPKLLSKKFRGTEYCIRLLPLGGYVKIEGDGDPEKKGEAKESRSHEGNLQNKSRLAQIGVMLAGVTMNILFAICIYFIIIGNSGWKMTLDWSFEGFKPVGAKIVKEVAGDVKYSEVIADGGAYVAKIPSEGTIKTIAGQEIIYSNQVGEVLRQHKNETVEMNICNDECKVYSIQVSDTGTIGIALSTNYYVIISYEDNKLTAGFAHLINTVRLIGIRLGDLFSEAKLTGDYSEISNSVSGPVGIYFLIDYFKNLGLISFLSVMGDLSLSLAIMNILPIPALDGGRVVILVIESIIRKNLNEKVKALIINGSFIFLMLFVIFIMIKDVLNVQDIQNMFK